MVEPIDIKQGEKNKAADAFMRGYEARGNKIRTISNEEAAHHGIAIESKPGATYGKIVETRPGGLKAFHDHMAKVHAQERATQDAKDRAAQAASNRRSFHLVSEHELPNWKKK